MNIEPTRSAAALTLAALSALCVLSFAGCQQPQDQLYLPQGNVSAGADSFQSLGCSRCHSIAGQNAEREAPHERIYVVLGGPQTRVTTYSELVSSIVNPDHELSRGNDPRTATSTGESLMENYNEVMTVQQLIDIVEYLKPMYYVWVPDRIDVP